MRNLQSGSRDSKPSIRSMGRDAVYPRRAIKVDPDALGIKTFATHETLRRFKAEISKRKDPDFGVVDRAGELITQLEQKYGAFLGYLDGNGSTFLNAAYIEDPDLAFNTNLAEDLMWNGCRLQGRLDNQGSARLYTIVLDNGANTLPLKLAEAGEYLLGVLEREAVGPMLEGYENGMSLREAVLMDANIKHEQAVASGGDTETTLRRIMAFAEWEESVINPLREFIDSLDESTRIELGIALMETILPQGRFDEAHNILDVMLGSETVLNTVINTLSKSDILNTLLQTRIPERIEGLLTFAAIYGRLTSHMVNEVLDSYLYKTDKEATLRVKDLALENDVELELSIHMSQRGTSRRSVVRPGFSGDAERTLATVRSWDFRR